jgi:hypothetical protein
MKENVCTIKVNDENKDNILEVLKNIKELNKLAINEIAKDVKKKKESKGE